MTDSSFRISHAALIAALVSSPVLAASDPAAIEQQLDALQQALAKQQEQIAQQQQEIERTSKARSSSSAPLLPNFRARSAALTGASVSACAATARAG